MKTFLHKSYFLSIVFLIANLFFASVAFGQATVETDLPDYSPGSTVNITGSGFTMGEEVVLQVVHHDDHPLGIDPQYHQPWTVIADTAGNIKGSWLVPTDGDALGAEFLLTADGQTSLLHAETIFSDAIIIWASPIDTNNSNSDNPYTTGQTFNSNISVSGIGRGSGISGDNANNRYNAKNWSLLSLLDVNDYFTFTLTPLPGYRINFNNFIYNAQRSGQGPASFAFRSNANSDNFSTNIGSPTSTGATISLTDPDYQNISTATEFRLYGWNATDIIGTFSINNFTFGGAILGTSFTSLTGFSTCINTASTAQYFTVNGVGLTINSTITIVPSANYELSTTSAIAGFQGTGNVTLTTSGMGALNGTVWVRLKAKATPGTYNGEIINVSGGGFAVGDNINVSVSGTVDAPTITAQPISSTIIYGANTTFSVTANGAPTLAYQWQEDAGSGFTNITLGGVYSDPTLVTLTLTKPGVAMSSRLYRCVVTNSCGSATSDGTAELTVTAKALTAATTVAPKVYNGSAVTGTVTLGTVTGLAGTETLVITPTASDYADKNVATGKATTISYGLADGTNGGLAANYSMENLATTANITALGITGNFTADNKVYNGDAVAAVLTQTLNGVIALDVLSLTGGTASFSDKVVGNGKTVTSSGMSLSGADAGNYSLTFVGTTIANITQKNLIVSATGINKVYDGTTAATVTISTDKVIGDIVNAVYTTASFEDKNVGTWIVNVGGISINGTDAGNYSFNTSATTTANITALTITVIPLADSKQYSDPDPVLLYTYNPALIDGDEFTGALSRVPDDAEIPGTYVITQGTLDLSDNYTLVFANPPIKYLTIIQEDACPYYTGALFASTASATSTNANVTLAATIQEISDDTAGDIRNAEVYFYIVETGQKLGPFTPGLVTEGDLTVGTVVYNWLVDIGNTNSTTYTVRIIVDGYYSNTNTCGDGETVVTVSKPLNDFITGGGYLKLTSSSGIKAGNVGTKNNFGFNVKFNKSKTNLQGNINTIIRRTETDGLLHIYQVKGNVMSSLAVQPSTSSTPPLSTFNGKANIQDITNPLAPISVDGNATLQVTMTDNGEPSAKSDPMDRISITVWNKSGGLWFASNWNGTKTIEQNIAGGNLKVQSSGSFVTGTLPSTTVLVSLNPSTVGQTVTFTATVSKSGTANLTGTVRFTDGNTTLATVQLGSSGIVSFTTSSLNVGSHLITAYYGGDSKFAPSAASLTQTVEAQTARKITSVIAKQEKAVIASADPTPFNVLAYPNPSNQYFNIEMKGGSTEKVDVMVYDVLGRTIKHIESSDGQFVRFGDELPTGVYIGVISQGMNQKTVRLIKE